MKTYRHKEIIQAWQILSIKANNIGFNGGGAEGTLLIELHGRRILADFDWGLRMNPKVGSYVVRYAEGKEHVLSKERFEAIYEVVDDDPPVISGGIYNNVIFSKRNDQTIERADTQVDAEARILESAADSSLTNLIVIGSKPDGGFFFENSAPSRNVLLWLLGHTTYLAEQEQAAPPRPSTKPSNWKVD